MSDIEGTAPDLLTLTADIVAAHASNNPLAAAEIPALIRDVHAALAGVGAPPPPTRPEPAVPIRQSVRPDHIVCLEDGKKLKMLKRHLKARYGLTPDAYRRRWGLPHDYPMVAPDYAEARRGLAKRMGLGTRPKVAAAR